MDWRKKPELSKNSAKYSLGGLSPSERSYYHRGFAPGATFFGTVKGLGGIQASGCQIEDVVRLLSKMEVHGHQVNCLLDRRRAHGKRDENVPPEIVERPWP